MAQHEGRPLAKIDWEVVKDLLIAGCLGTEIAASIGVRPTCLYDRCKTEIGQNFSEFSQEFLAKGEAILRAHQFAKALGRTDQGDNTLLIWLGKTRMRQVEYKETEIVTSPLQKDIDKAG